MTEYQLNIHQIIRLESLTQAINTDSKRSTKSIIEEALEYEIFIKGYDKKDTEPLLGLATTRELLEEIKVRGEISAMGGDYPEETGSMSLGAINLLDTLPGSVLDYRTVGSF